MTVEQWSEQIALVRLSPEPAFSEVMQALREHLADGGRPQDVVLDMSKVQTLNSSNLTQLLRIRKRQIESESKLRLTGLCDEVWSVFNVTGLDKIFEFSEDIPSALATVRMR
ncbi:MAG: STAS domain-containing protein [Phycisphaeraceae bacterium]